MMIQALRQVIKRMHYPLEVMLTCVRWYAAYPLSLRHIGARSTTPPCTAGPSKSCRYSPGRSGGANARWA